MGGSAAQPERQDAHQRAAGVEQPAAAGAGVEPVAALHDLAAVVAVQGDDFALAQLHADAAGIAHRHETLPHAQRRGACDAHRLSFQLRHPQQAKIVL